MTFSEELREALLRAKIKFIHSGIPTGLPERNPLGYVIYGDDFWGSRSGVDTILEAARRYLSFTDEAKDFSQPEGDVSDTE